MIEEKYFLDDPTLDYLFNKLPILINESDRGTLLLGVSQIDSELEILLDKIAPDEMSKKEKKWIYRATLSSKLNFAYTCRLIPKNLFDSINTLRHIRNQLSHKVEIFNLTDYTKEIEKIYNMIGENMSEWIHNISLHTLINNATLIAMEMKDPNDKNKLLFKTKQEALEYLRNSDNLQKKIEEPLLKTKLSFCVLIMCTLIIFHREKSLKILSKNKVISSLDIEY